MNQKHYFYCCVILLASAALWGCLRELDLRPNDEMIQLQEFDISSAQKYFENSSQNIIVHGVALNRSTNIEIIPLWKFSVFLKTDDYLIVETPLNIVPYYSWEKENYDLETHGKVLANTIIYMIAQKGDNDSINFKVAKFIADDDYIINNKKKFYKSPLLALIDFSGKAIYYDLKGNTLEGIIYQDGEQLGILIPNSTATKSTNSDDVTDEDSSSECFTIKWHDSTRSDELPEVEIIGTPSPYNPFPCYYRYDGNPPPEEGDGDEDHYGGGGGGGGGVYPGTGGENTNPPKTSLLADLKSLFKGNCELNEEQIKRLNEAFEEMNEECLYQSISKYFEDNDIKFRDIIMAENGWSGQAAINNLGDLKFANDDEINSFNLKHEWIHLFQREYTDIFANRGMAEFELALIQDILKFIEIEGNRKDVAYSWACFTTVNNTHEDSYIAWLKEITNGGRKFPTLIDYNKYYEFSEIFGEVSISYSTDRGYTYGMSTNYAPIAVYLFYIVRENCN